MRLGGEVHDGVDAVDRAGDRVGILDAGVHEVDVEAREVLAPAGVRELVEHDDVVAVVAQAQAHEGRADEAGAAADEQLHDTATRVARYSASPCCQGGSTTGSRRSLPRTL